MTHRTVPDATTAAATERAKAGAPPLGRRRPLPASTRTWLTSAEVAVLLHVSPKTINRWANEGRLDCLKTLGGHHRYDPAYIAELAEGHTFRPDSP